MTEPKKKPSRDNKAKNHISLEEGRKLAVRIFDRPRPQPQKLSDEQRERLNELRIETSDLISRIKKT